MSKFSSTGHLSTVQEVHIPNNWKPDSWRKFPALQQAVPILGVGAFDRMAHEIDELYVGQVLGDTGGDIPVVRPARVAGRGLPAALIRRRVCEELRVPVHAPGVDLRAAEEAGLLGRAHEDLGMPAQVLEQSRSPRLHCADQQKLGIAAAADGSVRCHGYPTWSRAPRSERFAAGSRTCIRSPSARSRAG